MVWPFTQETVRWYSTLKWWKLLLLLYINSHTNTLWFRIVSSISIESNCTQFTSFQWSIPGVINALKTIPSKWITVPYRIHIYITTAITFLTGGRISKQPCWVTMVTIVTLFAQITNMTFRAVGTNNLLTNQNTAWCKVAWARLTVIFSTLRRVSIEAIYASFTVIACGVVLADTLASHRITSVGMSITLTRNTPTKLKPKTTT